MSSQDWLSFGAALVFFVVGVVALRWWLAADKRPKRPGGKVVELDCHTCRRTMVFQREELRKLSSPEIALAVRSKLVPAGKALAEYTCPYCESAHLFVQEGKALTWIAADLDRPTESKGRCHECRTPLAMPHWPKGEYDGKILDAPGMRMDMGLKCPRCGATCCVNCTHEFTRNRAPKGEFLCPRCGRGPMNEYWHGQ